MKAPDHEQVLLEARGLGRRFGTFRAVDGVDLRVARGEVRAVIGPNGAGKTTLFRLLTGVLRPTSGALRFNGRSIVGRPPHAIARLGLSQVFQITNIFNRLSVLDSVCAALVSRDRGGWRVASKVGEATRREAVEILARVGLDTFAETESQTLSHGDQRALGIALALATRPVLLLLDEPTAGMSPFETERMVALIRGLVAGGNLTVILSEHDMDTVFGLSDRVTVMHQGKVIADGPAAEVRADSAVMAIYLGTEA